MAFYTDEDEVWKCSKHPSKRRRSGVCPVCLRERLGSLCPDCANVKPCGCCATTSSSSSSSVDGGSGLGSVGRLSSLIESEPAFRRSRSVAIPFLRSRSRFVGGDSISDLGGDRSELPPSGAGSRGKASSFWSVFRSSKKSRREGHDVDSVKKIELDEDNAALRKTMMMRSRSVAVPVRSVDSGTGEVKSSKNRSWYFPSPIKVFRQSKLSKIVQANSPLYRG
ncbi:hypothetical protein CsatB_004549 [Cannabis sativa]|uniref:Uncharacterized protein n=2 Tax=Cannabis sativa TaxID=3483 RepID=A0A7J6EI14_CANSA|nr:uncharacterized protein LOC115717136 [Cannabis sativa]KAF4357994.1 hypothetical protein F8388_008502 [Cannabis sativa]KAF4404379.1 hypothetical protein G4B88_014835 [Cannabis sativa]